MHQIEDAKLFTDDVLLKSDFILQNDKIDFIADFLYQKLRIFFNILKENLEWQWTAGSASGGYIRSNNGFAAMMIIFKEMIKYMRYRDGGASYVWHNLNVYKDKTATFLAPAISKFERMEESEINSMRAATGKGGQKIQAKKICMWINAVDNTFKPKFIEENDEESKQADINSSEYNHCRSIEITLRNLVKSQLETEYGPDKWWPQIPKEIRGNAVKRREEDETAGQEDAINFLDLIDYEKVISKHWSLFRKHIATDENASKEKNLKWLIEVNNLRKRIMHPTRKSLTEDEKARLAKLDTWINEVKDSIV